MLNLEVRSKKAPEQIMDRLTSYFGENGLGLELMRSCGDHMTFAGGGGYVTVRFCKDDQETVVNFESREWEIPVERFVRSKQF